MNRALLNKEVQDFLEENYNNDISKILFRGSPFPEVNPQELGIQLSGKKKAEKKLPTWFKNRNVLYPPTVNLEQTSSEITADYKASLVSGKSLADLTGGFGVDDLFFSRKVEKVIHCELDENLSAIAEHNFSIFGATNIEVFTGDGIKFLEESRRNFDWIYIDPSRRNEAGGRIFLLEECLPNVPQNLDLIWKRTENLLVKTSPLLDLRAGLREMNNVKEIHVVAVNNDVKELLWVSKKAFSGPVQVTTINFRKKGNDIYSDLIGEELGPSYGPPQNYLYEPNSAIMKSGLFSSVAKDFALIKLHPNTHLFTSEELKTFPGRRFRIKHIIPYKKKILRKRLDLSEGHITTRNFPESVEQLRKKLKLNDGGDTYLFFTTIPGEKKVVLVCDKI